MRNAKILPADTVLASFLIFNVLCPVSGALAKLFLFKSAETFPVDHRKTPQSLRNYNY